MPIYEYKCQACGDMIDEYRTVDDRNNCPQCSCGGDTNKVISAYRIAGDMQPYYDDNLQTFIKGKQHRKQVMKSQGVEENYGQGWHTSAVKHRKV